MSHALTHPTGETVTPAAASPGQLWEAYFDACPHGVMVLRAVRDAAGHIIDFAWEAFNSRAQELLELTGGELVGALVRDAGQAEADLFETYLAAMKAGTLELEQALPKGLRWNGAIPKAWYAVTLVAAGDHLIVQFSSISQRKAVLDEAVKLMNQDDLTGVGNRRLLKSVFWARRREKRPISILYLDLDGFKRVNDAFGHHTGDQVLRITAQRLAKSVRPGEVVARLGGDEFAVLLEVDNAATVAAVAERLADKLTRPIHIDGTHVEVGVSVGVAIYPQDGSSFEALLSAADDCMYEQKRRPR